MADPYVRAGARGCGRQILVLGVTVVLIGGLFLVAALAGALAPDPTARVVVIGVVFGIGALASVPLGLGFAAWRTRVLDQPFASLGLRGSGLLPNIREYRGTVANRAVDVFFARRGPLLQMSVGTARNTTLVVGTRTAIGDAAGHVLGGEVAIPDPAFRDYLVRADDPAWATQALADRRIRALVLGLVSEPEGREHRLLTLRPGSLQLTRRYARMPPAGADQQVRDLVDLAAAVETQPAPAREAPLTAAQRGRRTSPTRVGVILGFSLFAGMVVVAFVAFGIAMAVSRSAPSSASGPAPTSPPAQHRGGRR